MFSGLLEKDDRYEESIMVLVTVEIKHAIFSYFSVITVAALGCFSRALASGFLNFLVNDDWSVMCMLYDS